MRHALQETKYAMKITVLDSYTITQEDLSWDILKKQGHDITSYNRTSPEDVIDRLKDADVALLSKVIITKEIMEACPNLKLISVMATGYNNVDINAAKDLGITVCNVPAYSTESVAQHVFALILEITNNVSLYDAAIKAGQWQNSKDYAFFIKPYCLLSGKSIGIFGYGQIGKAVARIAESFGMNVYPYSQYPQQAITSDIITMHYPATDETIGMINKSFIEKMKDGAIFINTARGVLVNENDLADALKSGKISAAGLDVLSIEPPKSNPLIGLNNCFITPHIAWSPKEMREKVITVCRDNIESFLAGGHLNQVT